MKLSTRIRACCVAAGLLLGVQCVVAQPTVTLAQALDAAWQRTPDIAALAGQLRRAQAESAVAASLWAAPPSLELGHRTDALQSNRGVRETELGIAMPLWLPGQRAAKREAVSADLSVARAAEQAARLQLAGVLREALADIHLRRSDVDSAATEVKALDDLRADVERRVAAGDLATVDALAARAEVLAAQARLADARNQSARALSRWKLLTGLADVPAPTAADDPVLAVPLSASVSMQDHPFAVQAAARVEAARRKLDLQRQSPRGAPELVARLRQDVGGRTEPASNSIGFALRIPLGTDDRNAPLKAAALGELEMAEAERIRKLEEVQSELQVQREALAAATAQADAETTRAALLQERTRLLERSFKAGETSLPDMLRALSASNQAISTAQRARVGVLAARARLQQALGILP